MPHKHSKNLLAFWRKEGRDKHQGGPNLFILKHLTLASSKSYNVKNEIFQVCFEEEKTENAFTSFTKQKATKKKKWALMTDVSQ